MTAFYLRQVAVTTLDDCMEKYSWVRMDFIKIDAEGAEKNIIRGGLRFFELLSPLVMFEVEHAGVGNNDELVQAFTGIGYRIFRLVPALCILVPLDTSDKDAKPLNLFACKDDRAARLAERGLLLQTIPRSLPAGQIKNSGFWDLPYVKVLQDRWNLREDSQDKEDLNLAMEGFHLSRDTSRAVDERFAALQHSYGGLSALCGNNPTRLRSASLLRVEREFQSRQDARTGIGRQHRMMFKEMADEGALRSISDKAPGSSWIGKDALDDRLAEPFLTPLPKYDNSPPLSVGFDGFDGIHTWLVRGQVENMHSATMSTGFLPAGTVDELVSLSEAAMNAGLYNELLVRRQQLHWAYHKGKRLKGPVFMHNRAGDKVLNWLRRCIAESTGPAGLGAQAPAPAGMGLTKEHWRAVEIKLLFLLSSCCDPPGRENFLFGSPQSVD